MRVETDKIVFPDESEIITGFSVNNAILSFPNVVQAQFAATRLPDGQVVDIIEEKKRYRVQGGTLMYVENFLRDDLLEASGSSSVGFQQAVDFAAHRSVRDKIGEDFSLYDISGSDGTGETDNTSPVQLAVNSVGVRDVIKLSGGTFKVDEIVNPLGRKFTGGVIKKTEPFGGFTQLNSYTDTSQQFIGTEYLYRLFLRIRNSAQIGIKGFIYGDSTAATLANGGGYAGEAFEPQNLIPTLAARYGNFKFDLTNRAVGGTGVLDMNAVPDIDTVSGSTDLFIIKYGINDAGYGLDLFASGLRGKLEEIRNSSGHGSVSTLSIILVGPNATYDPEHGRTSMWYEQIRGIYEQAARDYGCAYFDAYAFMPKIKWAATAVGGLMMDDPYDNGQGIHPKEIMQTMLWGGLVDHVFGSSAWLPYVETGWTPLTLHNGWVAYGGGFAAPEARRINGTVEVRGFIKDGITTSGSLVATLPAGMWAKYAEAWPVISAGEITTQLRVNQVGQIELQAGNANNAYLSLSGIRFSN